MKQTAGRVFYLACVLIAPFWRFLLAQRYSLVRAEPLAASGVLLAVCCLAGWALRGVYFQAVLASAAGVMSAYPLQTLLPWLQPVPPALMAAVCGALTFALMRAMRDKFFPVLAVFCLSLPAVEFAVQHRPARPVRAQAAASAGGSLLWLVLDEQIGLDGFPATAPCQSARDRFRHVLDRYNFTSYPAAYSNYSSTFDSLPSILNGRLVRRREELMARQGAGHLRHYEVRENALFDNYAAHGFRVVCYQPSSVQSCRPGAGPAECREYRENLGWLAQAPGGRTQRFRWIVGSYQASDPLLVRVNGFFPFRFGLKMTGPLGVAGLWPDQLAREVLAEPARTFFFVHLLTPHLPYLYRADGSIRPIEEWGGDRPDERLSPAAYDQRYARYCGQSEFVAGQLGALLAELDRGGALRGMTVVVHGDHGSRIRAKGDGVIEAGDRVAPDAYDYRGAPDPRDLTDRFSALLAIKPSGAGSPARSDERHSLLTILNREVVRGAPAESREEADRVYLSADDGNFRAIDILNYWSDLK